MKRFLYGFGAGTASAVTTWAFTHHAVATVAVGLTVALIIWCWTVIEAIGELISAVFEVIFRALLP